MTRSGSDFSSPKKLFPSQGKPKQPRPRRAQEARAAWGMLLPSLGGITLFVFLPFLETIRRSFCDTLGEHWRGAENYRATVRNEAFRVASVNTARLIGLCLPLLFAGSFLIALVLSANALRDTRRARLLRTTFLLPLAIPTASIALLWKAVFAQKGLINAILAKLGAPPADFLGSEAAFGVLVLICLWKNIGLDILFWSAGLESVPREQYEAADVDGASGWQKLVFVTLPNLGASAFLVTVLSVLQSFKVFREAYLVMGGYPPESVYMIQHLLNNWFLAMDLPRLTAAATMLTAALLIPLALLVVVGDKGTDQPFS